MLLKVWAQHFGLREAVDAGHSVIASPSSPWYLASTGRFSLRDVYECVGPSSSSSSSSSSS